MADFVYIFFTMDEIVWGAIGILLFGYVPIVQTIEGKRDDSLGQIEAKISQNRPGLAMDNVHTTLVFIVMSKINELH